MRSFSLKVSRHALTQRVPLKDVLRRHADQLMGKEADACHPLPASPTSGAQPKAGLCSLFKSSTNAAQPSCTNPNVSPPMTSVEVQPPQAAYIPPSILRSPSNMSTKTGLSTKTTGDHFLKGSSGASIGPSSIRLDMDNASMVSHDAWGYKHH